MARTKARGGIAYIGIAALLQAATGPTGAQKSRFNPWCLSMER